MLLFVSFPGFSLAKVRYENLVDTRNHERLLKLKKMSDAREFVLQKINYELPVNTLIKVINDFMDMFFENALFLSNAKCRPPKFSWITAMLTSESRVDCSENCRNNQC